MEIKQTDSLLTFYPDANNNVEISCPECNAKKRIDVSAFKNNFKLIEVKCQCDTRFKCSIEFRRSYRVQVSLAGRYERLKNQKIGDMLVESLSIIGVGFVNMSCHLLEIGENLELKFQLDDKNRTEIRRKVKIISIERGYIGTEFIDKNCYDAALGFYLKV
jgi:hypothetical protein